MRLYLEDLAISYFVQRYNYRDGVRLLLCVHEQLVN